MLNVTTLLQALSASGLSDAEMRSLMANHSGMTALVGSTESSVRCALMALQQHGGLDLVSAVRVLMRHPSLLGLQLEGRDELGVADEGQQEVVDKAHAGIVAVDQWLRLRRSEWQQQWQQLWATEPDEGRFVDWNCWDDVMFDLAVRFGEETAGSMAGCFPEAILRALLQRVTNPFLRNYQAEMDAVWQLIAAERAQSDEFDKDSVIEVRAGRKNLSIASAVNSKPVPESFRRAPPSRSAARLYCMTVRGLHLSDSMPELSLTDTEFCGQLGVDPKQLLTWYKFTWEQGWLHGKH